jgi:hypothetical protein
MEGFTAIARITRASEFEASIHQVNVGPLSECIVDNSFVLVDRD